MNVRFAVRGVRRTLALGIPWGAAMAASWWVDDAHGAVASLRALVARPFDDVVPNAWVGRAVAVVFPLALGLAWVRVARAWNVSRVRLGAQVEHSPLAMLEWDEGLRLRRWSSRAEALFGWDRAEFAFARPDPRTLVDAEDAGRVERALRWLIEGRERQSVVTVRGRRRDGALIHCEWYVTALRDARGCVAGLHVLVQDVTDRVRAETRLRSAEYRLREAFDHAPVGIALVELDGQFAHANEYLSELLGYELGEFARLAVDDVFAPEDVVDVRRAFAETVAGKTRGFALERRCRRKDGSLAWVHLGGTLQRGEDGAPAHFVVQLHDVTERRALEAQLRHAQKMEAIGRLAGGIAHDFNNFLTAILGHCDLALRAAEGKGAVDDHLVQVRQAARGAAELTYQLLAFGRRQILEPRTLSLNEIVAGFDKLLRGVLGERVEVRTRLAADLAAVVADPGQIGQVVMNLAVNARDAMAEGGVLGIETSNAHLASERTVGGRTLAAGRYAVLEVTDTGSGMDEATRARIFEPFFTTKAEGEGTGLGLATVYGIVAQSGGAVEVESAPGRGSRFRVWLPASREPATAAAPDAGASERVVGGTERIVLVEDDEKVRRVGRIALERVGYAVTEAPSAEEALANCLREGRAPDLVVTDLVLPGKTGPELARELRARFPGLRVLFVSGYASARIDGRDVNAEGARFLRKPFSVADLLGHVRAALDGVAPSATAAARSSAARTIH